MRQQRLALVVFVVVCACAAAPVRGQAGGQEPDRSLRDEVSRLRQELEVLRQQYAERLAALETRLASLEGQQRPAAPQAGDVAAETAKPPAAEAGQGAQAPRGEPVQSAGVPAGAAGAGGPEGTLPVYGSPSALSKIFNPDIALVGDFLAAAGRNPVDPAPALQLHEAEISYQAIVDPFARADFFLAVSPEEGIDIEEGYVTFTSLPGSFLVKAGKLYAGYGKVNQMHRHVMPWSDRPLMNVNLVGGEEGVADAGVSVSRLISNPWIFLEATGEVFRGESDMFRAPRRRDLAYVGHLRGYRDLSESSNVDLGASIAYGHNDAVEQDGTTRLIGVDATFRYRPLRRAIYSRFLARTEMTWSRRSELGTSPQSFGAYVSGEYQFARRWTLGGRFDRSDRSADASVTDTGGSVLLTFRPSEFSQLRGQYRRTRYGDTRQVANEFLFQLLFSIGAHGAHPF